MRCKNCHNKFEPKYFLQKYCEKDECKTIEVRLTLEKVRRQKSKEEKKKFDKMRVEAKEPNYKKALQDNVNLLARMIDKKYGYNCCIDCNKFMAGQIDAAHYHSRGANSTLRYNLHNLHSANGYCNQHSPDHKGGYKIGLIERYGPKYCDYVLNVLPEKYPEIHLNAYDYKEKLKIVRKIIREFESYQFEGAKEARNEFNKIISIYK